MCDYRLTVFLCNPTNHSSQWYFVEKFIHSISLETANDPICILSLKTFVYPRFVTYKWTFADDEGAQLNPVLSMAAFLKLNATTANRKTNSMQEHQQNSEEEHMPGMDMGKRGVTRSDHGHPGSQDHNTKQEHKMPMDHAGMSMSVEDRRQMLHMHHMQTLWIYWTIILLGCWLILSPLTFSYAKGTVEPANGRPVWLSLAERISLMKWSDIISGILLVVIWVSFPATQPSCKCMDLLLCGRMAQHCTFAILVAIGRSLCY